MRASVALVFLLALPAQAADRRPVAVDDQFRFVDVGDPQISPDGEWILYTVTSHRRRRGPPQHRRLEGEVGWHRSAAR